MNYNSFFGFSDSPFLDDLDLRFLFLSKQNELFMAKLIEFVSHRQGIAVLSGEDGVGKTMLVHALMQRLPQSFQPLIINHPEVKAQAISLMIAQALGIAPGQRNLVNLSSLAEVVLGAAQQERYYLLVLEDAHVLMDQHLEEIYVLSQMEHQGQQLMPIMLVGRKGLVQKLAGKSNQRLQEVIRHNLALTGLSFEETTQYIDHRLRQVGSSFKACFAEGCLGQLFARTGGIPRRINQVCDQALNRAWQENQNRVTRDLIGGKEAATPYKPLIPPPKYSSPPRFGALAAVMLMLGLVGYVIYTNYYAKPLQTAPTVADSAASPSETLPGPQQEQSPVPPETVTQVQPPDQTEEGTAAQKQASPPEPQASQEPEPPQVLPQAESSIDSQKEPQVSLETKPPQVLPEAERSSVPQQETQAIEAETSRPTIHEVSPEDGGLLKIIAGYYPDEQEVGYGAVILANPQINNEDIIYPGQKLSLPIIDNSNVITLNNKQHYYMYKRYYNSTQIEQAIANLKGLEIRFVVRETRLPDAGPIYRIFLGGYDSKEELKEAMAMAEKG